MALLNTKYFIIDLSWLNSQQKLLCPAKSEILISVLWPNSGNSRFGRTISCQMQNYFWNVSHKKTIMAPACRYSGAVSGKILVHKRYQRLTSALKETALEPTLKPCTQTRCRKGGRDLRIKVFEVMESMKAKEEVPQHLQLVPVVRFYQKLQSLLAVPEKWNQKKKKMNQYFCPLQQPHWRLLFSI